MSVEGEEDGFESGEGFAAGNDAGEVGAEEDREEAEDDEFKVRVVGLESVVEPTAEVVVTGAGGGAAEKGGDLGGNFRVVEEGEGGVRSGGESRGDIWEDEF